MSTAEKLDRLAADQLKAEVPDGVIGREIIVLEETSSRPVRDRVLRLRRSERRTLAARLGESQQSGETERRRPARMASVDEDLGVSGKGNDLFQNLLERDVVE